MRRTPYPGRLEAYPTRCTDSGLLQRPVALPGASRRLQRIPAAQDRYTARFLPPHARLGSRFCMLRVRLHAACVPTACMHGSSSFSVPPLGAAHASSCPSILACCPCLRPRAAFLLDNPRCFMHVADRRLLRFFPCYST
jgi:hypothetical protein